MKRAFKYPLPPVAPVARRRRPCARAFTLIEILVVVSIIIILVGLAIVIGAQVQGKALKNNTQTTLTTLQGAMQDYLTDGNREPPIGLPVAVAPFTVPPDNDANVWVRALLSTPKSAPALAKLPTNGTYILDAYGHPIHYVPGNPVTKKTFYFVSDGPDRTANTADDIYSINPS